MHREKLPYNFPNCVARKEIALQFIQIALHREKLPCNFPNCIAQREITFKFQEKACFIANALQMRSAKLRNAFVFIWYICLVYYRYVGGNFKRHLTVRHESKLISNMEERQNEIFSCDMDIYEYQYALSTMDGENLLQQRMAVEHKFQLKENELNLHKHRAEKGMENNYSKALKEFSFSKQELFMVDREIEKRKMTISKNEINIKENHGIIQQGNNNTASQDFSKNEKISKSEINNHIITPDSTTKTFWYWVLTIIAAFGAIATIYQVFFSDKH